MEPDLEEHGLCKDGAGADALWRRRRGTPGSRVEIGSLCRAHPCSVYRCRDRGACGRGCNRCKRARDCPSRAPFEVADGPLAVFLVDFRFRTPVLDVDGHSAGSVFEGGEMVWDAAPHVREHVKDVLVAGTELGDF